MARLEEGGQKSFRDEPINNRDLEEACEKYLENKPAATEFRKADMSIKEILPAVDEPTRFCIGERYFIEVTPHERNGYEVREGTTQRKRVSDAHAATT